MTASSRMSPAEARQRIEAAFDRHKRGDLASAGRCYQDVLDHYPDEPRALHYLGLLLQQRGDSTQAIRLIGRSIEIDPGDPRAHNHLGLIHVRANDSKAAIACFERGLEHDPDHIELINNLANAVRTRDLLRAIDLYRRALTLQPRAAYIAYNLAQALDEDQQFDEALERYRQTITLDPRHYKARHSLGILLEQRGEFDEATDQYRMVQQLEPRHVSSLANLLGIRHFIPDNAIVIQARTILRLAEASDEDRIKLHRGLGKHHERLGDTEEAFSHFARAKALFQKTRPPFSATAAAAAMARSQQLFDQAHFARHAAPVSDSDRPIFIVGLPRSGTTLTEQIIASHPLAFGAGERDNIPKLVKSLRPGYPEDLPDLPHDMLVGFADDYLAALDRLAGPVATRITDKMPMNSLHLGLIGTLFPHARIIHCRRDPMDIALSCHFEIFELEHDFTGDFTDFGEYFVHHDRLMAHWKTVLPNPFHEVRYEDLIRDPEAATRSLIDFCGLDWDPACLEFQKTERTVQTPSRWQVRQPIYQTSVGRWKRYAAQMDGLARMLEAAGYRYADAPAHAQADRLPAQPRTELAAPPAPAMPAALRRPVFIVAAPRSGSTLLFETLSRSEGLATLGGEAHWLVENLPELCPGATGVESNRLTAVHATDAVGQFIVRQIMDRLEGGERSGSPVFLEKTPKNALRIPFFDRIFPDARFIFLWRDPRENIGSIMEAWRSGRFTTYRRPDGFDGAWSLLLPPNYQRCNGKPVEEIAAFQWSQTNRLILDDLEALDRRRWTSVRYGDLLSDPARAVGELLRFLDIDTDPSIEAHLRQPLPHSRYTHSAPAPDKWRANEAEIERVLPGIEPVWQRLRTSA